MEVNHQVVNSLETEAVLPRFLIARGYLLLAISFRCSVLISRASTLLSSFTSLFS